MVQLATRTKDQAKLTTGFFRKAKTKQIVYHEKLHLLENRAYQQLQGTGIVLQGRTQYRCMGVQMYTICTPNNFDKQRFNLYAYTYRYTCN